MSNTIIFEEKLQGLINTIWQDGFMNHNEYLPQRYQELKELFRTEMLEIIGEDVDIQKVVNPTGSSAGNHYPNLVDLPMQGIASQMEGINQFKAEQHKALEEKLGEADKTDA